jgi:hypothetical protein
LIAWLGGISLESEVNSIAVASARREVGKWLNEGPLRPAPKHELAILCAAFDKQQTALQVVRTWAGFKGALAPKHVLELTGKALGIEP